MYLLATCAIIVGASAINNRPIIGILANGPNDTSINAPYTAHDAYIAASYVKWIEAAGARVAPIPWFIEATALKKLVKSLNGFVLPGGGVHFFSPSNGTGTGQLSPYGRTTRAIFDEVVASWAAGESVPLWGTCLGHEILMTHLANDERAVLTPFESENVSLPLNFTTSAATSRLWGTAPSDVLATLVGQAVTMNLHEEGISPATFAATPSLSSRMNVLSTNMDTRGREFVSSTEGKDGLPIFTTQFHPEKVQFEWWSIEQLAHSYSAVVANAWTARVFVDQVRRGNSRRFPTIDLEAAALIYNYNALYTGNPGSQPANASVPGTLPGYMQTYFFDIATYVPPV